MNLDTQHDILIVDDDPSVNWLVKGWIDDAGYKSHTAQNAIQALELLKALPGIDILLTDIRMPIIDGNELIREALKLRPDLGIIIMTAHADDVRSVDTYPVIRKPFDPAELEELLARIEPRHNA